MTRERKNTWVKVKSGLLEPKHREKLGVRIWLYLYMLDVVDWETGTISGWIDKDHADKMQMPWKTLQRQRQQLETDRYIDCIQVGGRGLVIYVLNWTDPRRYDSEVINPSMGTQSVSRVRKNEYPGHHKSEYPYIIDHIKDHKAPDGAKLNNHQKRTVAALERGIKGHQSLMGEVTQHLRINLRERNKTHKELIEFLKSRLAEGQTVEQFAGWWYSNDWRGKQEQPPRVTDIIELWPQAFHEKPKPKQPEYTEVWE